MQETLPPRQQFGRYEIVRLLGAGGFAAVYEALDPALDATVAVKVLGDNHCVDPDVRSRFIKEARLLRRVGTDRLVPVFDIGEQGGQPYFVMELIPGGTLADRLADRGPRSGSGLRSGSVDHGTVRHIVIELAECLDAVHRAGIVHRDIKPSNILIRRPGGQDRPSSSSELLDRNEHLVLGDFGIAREVDASNLTMAVGTVGFMAPEQRSPSASIDQRADLYAATAIVATLLTPPGTVAATGHVAGTAGTGAGADGPANAGPHIALAGLSPQLRAALARGMATDPDARPASAAEWRAMLLHALPADEGRTRLLSPIYEAGPRPPPGDVDDRSAPAASRRSETTSSGPRFTGVRFPVVRVPEARVLAALLAVFVALVIGGVALLMTLTGGEPRIVGPETIRVGQAVVYRAETSPGAEYYWLDWNGVRHDQEGLRVEPRGPGVLPIVLTQVVDGQQRTETLVIKVLE